MKSFAQWSLLCLALQALAVPTHDTQVPLAFSSHGLEEFATHAIEHVQHAAQNAAHNAQKAVSDGITHMEKWFADGREFLRQNGLVYELVSHPLFANYRLRFTEPTLCDPSVKQYSGYLDVAHDKHLFFWFFEARTDPETAPLVLWLNGGPGCSSSTGLLFELGPCNIRNEGRNTTFNPHSWNTHANIIFLDQPVQVGFSYADDGTIVSTSPVAGKDVYAFLELFLNRFPKYADAPFHIAAESYGGIYTPNIASVIYNQNKENALAPVPGIKKINLATIAIGNGITDPYIQMGAVADWACEGPYPVYDDPNGPQCSSLRAKQPICQSFIKRCYDFNSRFTCVPAGVYCHTQLFLPLLQLGLNPYDVRRKCNRQTDGDLCYKEMNWIETWMNDPSHKAALGVDPDRNFQSCNGEVNRAFSMQGDGVRNAASLLPELINNGIRLLIYAGNADMMCNFMGNERWVEHLDNKFHQEFSEAKSVPWVTSNTGKLAGTVRSAGGGGFTAGNLTFVVIHEAGHMVPYDQPEAAHDLFTRWIANKPLS